MTEAEADLIARVAADAFRRFVSDQQLTDKPPAEQRIWCSAMAAAALGSLRLVMRPDEFVQLHEALLETAVELAATDSGAGPLVLQ